MASELRAYREQQRQLWGDLDTSTLGRYLADDVTAEERREVEDALGAYPELRRLTDLVRDVLTDCEPVPAPPVRTAPPVHPVVLPFRPRPAHRSRFAARARRHGALLAAACLLLGLGLFLTQPRLRDPAPAPRAESVVEVALAGTATAEHGDVARRDEPLLLAAAAEIPVEHRRFVTEVDRQVLAYEKQGKHDAALAAAEKYTEVAARGGDREQLFLAPRLARLAGMYCQQGALQRAEPALRKAHSIAREAYGADDPRTVQHTRQLARLYETALNAPLQELTAFKIQPAVAAGPASPAPLADPHGAVSAAGLSVPPSGADAGKTRSTGQLRVLRERITRQRPDDVRSAVLPVLMQAAAGARGSEDRVRYFRAMGEIGPAARDAVPLLVRHLQTTSSQEERSCILAALGRIGPAASLTLPTLKAHLTDGEANTCEVAVDALLRCGPAGRLALQEAARGARPGKDGLAPRIELRVRTMGIHTGIVDAAQLFTPYALRRMQTTLAELAARSGVEVFVETIPEAPAGALGKPRERARLLESDGIFVLVCARPPWVKVHLGESARARLSAAQVDLLQAQLDRLLQQGEYDAVLAQVGETLKAFLDQNSQP